MWKKGNASFCYISNVVRATPRKICVINLYGQIIASKKGKEGSKIDGKDKFIILPSALDGIKKFEQHNYEILACVNFVKHSHDILILFQEVSSYFENNQISLSIIGKITSVDNTMQECLEEYLLHTHPLNKEDVVEYITKDLVSQKLDLNFLNQKSVIIAVGNPKCGKTKLCRDISNSYSLPLLELNNLSYNEINNLITETFNKQNSFVIDGVFNSKSDRNLLYRMALTNSYTVHIFWILKDGRKFNNLLPKKDQVSSSTYNTYTNKFSDDFCEDKNVKLQIITNLE
jgi:hypothetical protein